MTTPLQDQIQAIHSVVVKTLNSLNHIDHYHTQVPSSEVLTLAVYACLEYGGNYSKTIKQCKEGRVFVRILEKSRFCRRLVKLAEIIPRVTDSIASLAQTTIDHNVSLNLEKNLFIVDTKPIPICQNIRICRCKLTDNNWNKIDQDYRGYVASKRQYYYGFKLSLLVNCLGIPVEYTLHPASIGDLPSLYHLNLNLPSNSEILADKIYNSECVKDYLKTQNIDFSPIAKNSSKQKNDIFRQARINRFRKIIETTFSLLSELVPRLRVTSLTGAIIKANLLVLTLSFYQCFRLGILS